MKEPTLSELENLTGEQILKMNKETALIYARKASKVANKRRTTFINKMEEWGIKTVSSSFREWSYEDKDGFQSYMDFDFNVNGNMRISEIKYKLRMTTNFLKNKTSIASNWLKQMQEFAGRLGISTKRLTKNNYKRIWKLYNRATELDIVRTSNLPSEQLQKTIADLIIKRRTKGMDDNFIENFRTKHSIPLGQRLSSEQYNLFILEYLENQSKKMYDAKQKSKEMILQYDEKNNPFGINGGKHK